MFLSTTERTLSPGWARHTSGLELTAGSLGVWLERERSCALVIASFRDEQRADAVVVAH